MTVVRDLGTFSRVWSLDELEAQHWSTVVVSAGASVLCQRFGDRVRAFITPGADSSLYSRALGFGPEDHVHVEDVVKWYRDHDRVPRLDLQPSVVSERYREALQGLGMAPGGLPYFGKRLRFQIGAPNPVAVQIPAGMTPVLVSEQHVDAYVALKHENRLLSTAQVQVERQHILATSQDASFIRYMLLAGGRPVAFGELFVHGEAGWLSGAGTQEAYRKRGCQACLIALRLQHAPRNCRVIATLVQVESQSDRNLAAAGFDRFIDRELWLPLDWMQRMPGRP